MAKTQGPHASGGAALKAKGMKTGWQAGCAIALALALSLGLPLPAQALYRLDYGDSVNVTVQGHPEYSTAAAIRPDGMISVPTVGEVLAIGLTPEALGQRIKALVARYVREPIVFCVVTQLRPREIYVLGQVRNPGRILLTRANPTILDAVSAAGGFTNRAVDDKVVVLRGDGEAMERIEVNVRGILRGNDFSGNMVVLPGDRIVVNEVWWPDFQGIMTVLAPIIAFVSLLGLVFNFYNFLAGPAE